MRRGPGDLADCNCAYPVNRRKPPARSARRADLRLPALCARDVPLQIQRQVPGWQNCHEELMRHEPESERCKTELEMTYKPGRQDGESI